MACQEASMLCSGLGNNSFAAFTSRRQPLKRSYALNRVPQCVLGDTQRSSRCSARSEPHIKQIVSNVAKAATAVACSTLLAVAGAHARLEGVNKPELLPDSFTTVIDVAGFLTPGEEARIAKEVENLENDTGVKLRVLAQNYPTTPGLAVRDYWKVDDDTVVFVADPSLGGNILNFNVGGNIDLRIPRNFWTRLSSKYGTKYYWQERGEGSAIVNAVSAIDTCAREPMGRLQCSKIQGELGEEPSAGPIEKMFLGG